MTDRSAVGEGMDEAISFFSLSGVMSICQGVLPVRQDVPLIVDCRKTYFIQFYRAQIVIDRPKLMEFGFGCGR